MIYIAGLSTDPCINLAVEEYVQANFTDEPYLLLWQNHRTVVIGRNQNALAEVRRETAEDLDVTVVRRNTGGGAVYHDLGNLNFSYITDYNASGSGMDFDVFVRPVVSALNQIGIPAEKCGRNDIVVSGKKISGNAQSVIGSRILHHGTLLIQSDLAMMPKVLNVSTDKIRSKGIRSVRSRVANINEFLPEPMTVDAIRTLLIRSFFAGAPVRERTFTQAELEEITTLADTKYRTWTWTYGASPPYTYHNKQHFPSGEIEVFVQVTDGLIKQCKIMGDFLALQPLGPLEDALIGLPFTSAAIGDRLASLPLQADYGIRQAELLACFTAE